MSLRKIYSSGSQLLPELIDLLEMVFELVFLDRHLVSCLLLVFLIAKVWIKEQSPDLGSSLYSIWAIIVKIFEISKYRVETCRVYGAIINLNESGP